MRRGEKNGDAFIDRHAVCIREGLVTGLAWRKWPAQQRNDKGPQIGARNSYYPDPAPTRGGCNGCDRFGHRARHYRCGVAARRAILREIYHCCAIDKRLFTHQYSTSPDGKKNIIPPNTSGMNIMTFA